MTKSYVFPQNLTKFICNRTN